MRKVFAWVAVLLLTMGCTESSPRVIAEGYLGALSRVDFEAASQFVADEGRANFESLRRLYADLGPEERKKFPVTDWMITGESVGGGIATVDFTFDEVKKGQLSLHRVGGVWKVDHRRTF